jgi:hypothetical protein
MKTSLVLVTLLVASSSFAANFGTSGATTAKGAAMPATATSTPQLLTIAGPQVGGLFRVVKPDGATVIQQGTMSAGTSSIPTITVSETDALVKANGKCAFNVKYDEISSSAATSTTNRTYSNDAVVAINSKIDLAAGVMKTIWTQPYLFAGTNNVKLVINADSATPSTGWIRINVTGACGGTAKAPETPKAPTTAAPTTPEKPKTDTGTPNTTTPPATVKFTPGSNEWNNLNNAFGYSNYGVTQLKGKGYARYDELVKLNAAITAAINAKSVDQGAYNSLMTSWNTFVTDAAFKAAMAAIVPGTSGQK